MTGKCFLWRITRESLAHSLLSNCLLLIYRLDKAIAGWQLYDELVSVGEINQAKATEVVHPLDRGWITESCESQRSSGSMDQQWN